MTYALIDNASITAVERATGNAVTRNPDTISGDLAAVENFVQAILFYDELITIDNYKANYRNLRRQRFEFIKFLDAGVPGIDQVDRRALAEARSMQPEIRSGEFADPDFRELIELLKLNMICTWDMRSSVYYLTLKMLGQPSSPEYQKYTDVSAAIFSELADVSETKGYWSKEVRLVGSDGRVFAKEDFSSKRSEYGGLTNSLETFVAALNWLAYKTIFYSLAAAHLRADTFIHPIRHAYQVHWMRKTGAFGHDFTSRLVKSLERQGRELIADITGHGRSSAIALEVPFFSAWLTQEAGTVEEAIRSALEIRNREEFVQMRGLLKEVTVTYESKGLAGANSKITKLLRDLQKMSGDLRRSYGVPSPNGIQGSFLIKTLNFVAGMPGIPALPDREFAISTPEFLRNNAQTSFAAILKNITNELTAVERLGSVREKMIQQFKIDDEYYMRPKTEDPRYRRVASHWKMPM